MKLQIAQLQRDNYNKSCKIIPLHGLKTWNSSVSPFPLRFCRPQVAKYGSPRGYVTDDVPQRIRKMYHEFFWFFFKTVTYWLIFKRVKQYSFEHEGGLIYFNLTKQIPITLPSKLLFQLSLAYLQQPWNTLKSNLAARMAKLYKELKWG